MGAPFHLENGFLQNCIHLLVPPPPPTYHRSSGEEGSSAHGQAVNIAGPQANRVSPPFGQERAAREPHHPPQERPAAISRPRWLRHDRRTPTRQRHPRPPRPAVARPARPGQDPHPPLAAAAPR